jgi:DNA polymerase III psi subunit
MCIADGANKVAAGGSPIPTDEELHGQLDQALEAYRRLVETQEHELEDRADWLKDLHKATLDMSLGFFDQGLKGLLGDESKPLQEWQSGMRHEVIANRKQIEELSALADAEKDAAKSAALRQQIFDLSMRNQLLHTGLHAIRNAKTMYEGYEMGAPARDAVLWATDSGNSLGNSGPLLDKVAPLEHAKRLDVSNIVPKEQSGVTAMLAAARNSGGLEDSMDGVKQLLKITMNQPGVKTWLKASSETLGVGTGITEWYEGLSLTIDTAYDLSVGYAGYARLKQIKSNVAQLEKAKTMLAERVRRLNAQLACYAR